MNKTTFKDWGHPDGIAGSITAEAEKEQIHQALKILFYRMGLSVRKGYFDLLKEPHHTPEDVKNAENWLQKNQDVVSIIVTEQIG